MSALLHRTQNGPRQLCLAEEEATCQPCRRRPQGPFQARQSQSTARALRTTEQGQIEAGTGHEEDPSPPVKIEETETRFCYPEANSVRDLIKILREIIIRGCDKYEFMK